MKTVLSERSFSAMSPAAELTVAWLFYTIACTHEFDELPVRHNEEILNEQLSGGLMWGADTSGLQSSKQSLSYINPDVYADPHTKYVNKNRCSLRLLFCCRLTFLSGVSFLSRPISKRQSCI
jgi:Sec63 Brl domain